jgi:hypothetical protein
VYFTLIQARQYLDAFALGNQQTKKKTVLELN